MTTFLDTSIVIALLRPDDPHHEWSVNQLIARRAEGPAIISDVVFAEMSVAMPDLNSAKQAIEMLALDRMPSSDEALFRAGKAFKQYKEDRNGPKSGVLPDFLIGAVAEVTDVALMTANRRDFIAYFPTLNLISPPPNAPVQAPPLKA
jgi:predicted nucleic acid-binding protein